MIKTKWKQYLAVGVLTMVCLSGCGADQAPAETGAQNVMGEAIDKSAEAAQGSTEAPAQEAEGQKAAAQGYQFTYGGVSFGPDMDMDALAEQLGEPKSVYEVPSCAGQGVAYLYSYPGFEVETYPEGEKNLIAYIVLKDDTVATPEGADLSQTRADIIGIYGDNYEEGDNRISYVTDTMTLKFIFEGENVASIEYVSGTMG